MLLGGDVEVYSFLGKSSPEKVSNMWRSKTGKMWISVYKNKSSAYNDVKLNPDFLKQLKRYFISTLSLYTLSVYNLKHRIFRIKRIN